MNDKVSVQVVTFGAMNFAMQQNYVPFVRSVTIKNNSDEEIKDIMLKISFEPEFAKPFTHRIEVLPPHTEIEVSPVNIIVSTEFSRAYSIILSFIPYPSFIRWGRIYEHLAPIVLSPRNAIAPLIIPSTS